MTNDDQQVFQTDATPPLQGEVALRCEEKNIRPLTTSFLASSEAMLESHQDTSFRRD